MKKVILYLAVAFSSGLFFTMIYNSVVNATNWENNVPDSITATKNFFVVANPGTFFQVIDPANFILAILALLLLWKESASIRLYLGIAIACYISSMILTFSYFYPRNEIMFLSEHLPDTETLKRVANEWGTMNWFRTFLLFVGLVCTVLTMDKYMSQGKKFRAQGS